MLNSEEKEKTGCTGVFDCKGREITLAQHSPFPRLRSSQDDNDGSNSLAKSEPDTQPVVLGSVTSNQCKREHDIENSFGSPSPVKKKTRLHIIEDKGTKACRSSQTRVREKSL